MKCAAMLVAALAAFASDAHAAVVYDSYDAFYSAQPGAVFGDPIKNDASVVNSYPGEQGIHTNLRSTLDGKAVRIEVAGNRIVVDGETYRFARATTFPDEQAIDIYPDSANVFLAAGTSNRPSLLGVEGGQRFRRSRSTPANISLGEPSCAEAHVFASTQFAFVMSGCSGDEGREACFSEEQLSVR